MSGREWEIVRERGRKKRESECKRRDPRHSRWIRNIWRLGDNKSLLSRRFIANANKNLIEDKLILGVTRPETQLRYLEAPYGFALTIAFQGVLRWTTTRIQLIRYTGNRAGTALFTIENLGWWLIDTFITVRLHFGLEFKKLLLNEDHKNLKLIWRVRQWIREKKR